MRVRTLLASLLLVTALVVARPGAAAAGVSGPVWARNFADWNRTSSPTIADVNGDGLGDVVFGSQDGWLRVLDIRTGRDLPGWPQPAVPDPGRRGAPSAIDASPTVADLDRDGAPEIIVGVGSTWHRDHPGGVVVFRRDGSVRCRFATGPGLGVYSTPAVGDVDGDGFPDFVFGSFDMWVHALDRNCRELPGFGFFQHDTVWSSPVLYDVDGDRKMEVFVGGDSSPGGPEGWPGGDFRRLDWEGGRVVQVWKQTISDTFYASPALGDIDGDGRLEVVTGAGDFYGHPDGRRVWAFHVDDGSWVPGWPQATGGTALSSPSIGDLDGDGRVREVVLGNKDGNVYAFRGNGARLWTARPWGGSHIDAASPVVADLNGDGAEDVVIGNDYAVHAFDGRNGRQLWRIGAEWSYDTAPALGYFGELGWRLVISGINTPLHTSRVEVYRVSAPRRAPSWPMWRKNARHLGAPPSDGPPLPPGLCRAPSNPAREPSARSARGYWVLGADGGVFSFRAPFEGSLPGRGVVARTVSIAATPSGDGYWLLDDHGGVHAFGDARYYGGMAGKPLWGPVRRIVSTPTGKGYWLLGSDGGVFSFGDAAFHGSTGGMWLTAPIVSMEATPTGKGYWLLGFDGGVFSFGDAAFHGSTGGMRLAAPVLAMAVRPQGDGYWLVAADGGVFSFGGARFFGSLPGTGRCSIPLGTQMRASSTGKGYWVLGADGQIFTFGDARHLGQYAGLSGGRVAIDMAIRR